MAEEKQAQDFTDTPGGWAKRWHMELAAAKKALEKWHKQGEKVVSRAVDERDDDSSSGEDTKRLNLFHANLETQEAMLYGQVPKVDCGRRFADAEDDSARLAGEMLERLLNEDIQASHDTYAAAMRLALSDWLRPGLGAARIRYEMGTPETTEGQPALLGPDGTEKAPAVEGVESRPHEAACVDYVYWRDLLWSPCRTWEDVTWVAFRAYMTPKALEARFGEDAKGVPLNAKGAKDVAQADAQKASPWDRAEVWEVWDKESRRVFWVVDGYPTTLDMQEDPLGLDGFFPCAKPLLANLTSRALVPKPDFTIAQDLYNSIDEATQRIDLLRKALRVLGVYDKASAAGLGQMLTGDGNKMVPVESWAMFAEKGGIKGVVDWFPLEQVVGAMDKLREVRAEDIALLQQVTGMSDIMRGQSSASTTATEQSIKAKFASVRMQHRQDEFARFASDTQRLKAEVIARHFQPETIIQRSNVMQTADGKAPDGPQRVQQAVALLQSEVSCYRVEVKPESVSLTDFSALKTERGEFIQALSTFLQASVPAAQGLPGSAPYLLEMLQWAMAGFQGAATVEGILDRAIDEAKKAAATPKPPAPPDPKLAVAQVKAQGDMQRVQSELQADLIKIGAQAKADTQAQAAQAHFNIQEEAVRARLKAATAPVDAVTHPQGVL